MDKKKLIGTIIGVALFAALIVGATYAWLTFRLSVTNGNYAGETKKFIINYEGDTSIVDAESDEGIPTLENPTTETARVLVVSAYRDEDNPDGIFYLKMHSDSNNALTTGGALNYAVCEGTLESNTESGGTNVYSSNCAGNLNSSNENILSIDNVTKTGVTELYNTGTQGIPTTKTYYMIYFWLDPSKITNDMVGTGDKAYSGYIYASAEQRDDLSNISE